MANLPRDKKCPELELNSSRWGFNGVFMVFSSKAHGPYLSMKALDGSTKGAMRAPWKQLGCLPWRKQQVRWCVPMGLSWWRPPHTFLCFFDLLLPWKYNGRRYEFPLFVGGGRSFQYFHLLNIPRPYSGEYTTSFHKYIRYTSTYLLQLRSFINFQ